MFEKSYSPSRAREALRFVRPAAERIRALYHRLERRRPRSVIPEQRVEAAYFIVLRDLQSIVDRLAAEGVRVKDPKQGLIDFPARRAGRRPSRCTRAARSSSSCVQSSACPVSYPFSCLGWSGSRVHSPAARRGCNPLRLQSRGAALLLRSPR